MYQIRRTEYGIHLTFSGHIQPEEMQQWLDESRQVLSDTRERFGVFVDMRHMILLPPDSQPAMREGQQIYREAGMVRSVVILADEVLALQFRRLAKQSGIFDHERYIDASSVRNWEQVGLDWIIKGIEPYEEDDPTLNDSVRLVIPEIDKQEPLT